MNINKSGYVYAATLRKTRRRYGLSASSQALYYELVAIANEEGWPDTFKCSNGELENNLRISENTLKGIRNELIQGGLIRYKSGKSKREFSDYSLLVSNFDPNADTNADSNKGTNADPNTADYNKVKDKTIEIVEYGPALDFFKTTRNYRIVLEKNNLTDDQLIAHFDFFYHSKVDLGEFKRKTKEDIVKHFTFWLPDYLVSQKNKKANNAPAGAERGTAAVINKFSTTKMRDS